METPEEEEKGKQIQEISDMWMTQSFPKLMADTKPQIQ